MGLGRHFRRRKQAPAGRKGSQLSEGRNAAGRAVGHSKEVMSTEGNKEIAADRQTSKDEETGLAAQPGSTSRPWILHCNWEIWRRLRAVVKSKPRFWGLFHGFQLGRQIEADQVLQVESIKRVINISKDPKALYHAALNLRSITDLELLQLVCEDERATRGLRECYFEALRELEKTRDPVKQHPELLQKTLAFGTAFFHVALSAASFDDFLKIMGTSGVTLGLGSLGLPTQAAQTTGDNCRRAQSFVRQFMNLQMRRLGPQPRALTSTTLAASSLWYAINGIPHSQDVVYGSQFREALATSDVSWAGLGLLALVGNKPCKFSDHTQRMPYETKELDWCHEAFLHVRTAYHLCGPTKQLADAIRDSLSTEKNLGSKAILFKFSWRLFSRDDEEYSNLVELGEDALSKGHHLLRALEKAIRSQKVIRSENATEYRAAIKYLERDGEKKNSRKPTGDLEVLSAQVANEATKNLEALSAEVVISEEEAARALRVLSPQKALSVQEAAGSPAESTSLEAAPGSPGESTPEAAPGSPAESTPEAAAFRAAFRAAIGALTAIGTLAELEFLNAGLLSAIRSRSVIEALAAMRSQRVIRLLGVFRALVVFRALSPQNGNRGSGINGRDQAIIQAATSARKALRAQRATEAHERAREMCFDAMIECMGPSHAEFSVLKRTAWRQRLALKTATAYMEDILEIKENGGDHDDAFAKGVMDRIRGAQTQNPRVIAALGTQHAEIKKKFEEVFDKLWPSKPSGANDSLQQGASAAS
ncbi:hypothetical protein FRC01_007730, partial [Tulasnella sp. 417]